MSLGKTSTLNTGHKIPTLGYGTWQAAPGEVGAGVREAIKAGYRHLDLAKVYANQPEVADGIKQGLADVPGLKREDLFITSKLWNTRHNPAEVEGALDETLSELQLDYLDLYLIHWPVSFPSSGDNLFPLQEGKQVVVLDESVTLSETWIALTKLPKSKARSVGVSNFTIEHLETVIADSGVVPAANQIERHPRLPQPELIDFCNKKGIHITCYSAFGNNDFGVPLLVNNPDVKAIADRLGNGATAAQVILAWAQLGGSSVIPKSVTPARIRQNFQEIELDDEAIKALAKIGETPERYNVPFTYGKKWDINIWGDEKEKDGAHKPVLRK